MRRAVWGQGLWFIVRASMNESVFMWSALSWITPKLCLRGVGDDGGAQHSCLASLCFTRWHKKAAQSAARRVGPPPLVHRQGP